MPPCVISGISSGFPGLSQSQGQVAHVLLTRSPLIPERGSPFDLHVLSTPPAFVLSQDQTLRRCIRSGREPRASTLDINQPKESQPDPKIRHGVKLGTDFRHAVEFSKSGRTRTPAFRPSFETFSRCTPHNGRLPQELPAGPGRGLARRREKVTSVGGPC